MLPPLQNPGRFREMGSPGLRFQTAASVITTRMAIQFGDRRFVERGLGVYSGVSRRWYLERALIKVANVWVRLNREKDLTRLVLGRGRFMASMGTPAPLLSSMPRHRAAATRLSRHSCRATTY